jgi:tRNA-specific 2-thiouridylase
LSKSIFPLGEFTKPQVRDMAQQRGLNNFDKKDSTGICFIGERQFKQFLSQYLPAQPGDICTLDGKRIGQHDGLMYYTLGQRQGLGIGGSSEGDGQAWYVVRKNLTDNTLLVAQGHDHPSQFSDTVVATQPHWIADIPDELPFPCCAKTRYRQADQPCNIIQLDRNSCTVRFDNPQRAVTPGQSIVFYSGEECLGGAIIDTSFISD